MMNIGGALCQELVDGYTEGAGAQQGLTSTKKLLCDWTNRYLVANTLLGFASAARPNSGLFFNAPMAHPESPNMVAREVQIRGAGTPFQGPKQLAFPYAVVEVQYGVFTWNALPNYFDPMNFDPGGPMTYATQEIRKSYEFITIPGRKLVYHDPTPGSLYVDNPLYDENGGFLSTNITLHVTLHRLTWNPWYYQIGPVITGGMLNQYPFLGAAPGRLRYDGADTRIVIQTDGTRTCELTHSFTYRSFAPWDYGYNAKAPTFDKWWRVQNADGTALINRVDFSPLFPSDYYVASGQYIPDPVAYP